MDKDEIIRMAREAGLWPGVTDVFPKELERFAALVAAHEREKQAEQEPVGRWNWNEAKFEWLTKFDYHKHHMTPLYAAPQPLKQEPDDLDWITPEAVFEAKLKLHGIPNPPVQQVDLTELLDIMVGMANYIDKLGGDSKGYRAVIAADREKNK